MPLSISPVKFGGIRNARPGLVPVVQLQAAPKSQTKFGRKSKPFFKVVDWRGGRPRRISANRASPPAVEGDNEPSNPLVAPQAAAASTPAAPLLFSRDIFDECETALASALFPAAKPTAVFPCLADKRPACPHGFKDATGPTQQNCANYGRVSQACLLGVPTGEKFVVLDLDFQHTESAALVSQRQPAGDKNACHAFRRSSPILQAERRDQEQCPPRGVDTRGLGGYTIWLPGCWP